MTPNEIVDGIFERGGDPVDGILKAGDFFGFKGKIALNIDDIEGVAHELGHWVALGKKRKPPARQRVVRVWDGTRMRNELVWDGADLGTSIDREVNRMSRARRNANADGRSSNASRH